MDQKSSRGGHLEVLRKIESVLPQLVGRWEEDIIPLIIRLTSSIFAPPSKETLRIDLAQVYEIRAKKLSWGIGGTGYLGFFSSRLGIRHIFLSRLESILRFAPDAPSRTLDVGCGAGIISLVLAERSEKVVGIDISRSAVEFAGMLARKLGIENVEFKEGRVEDMSFGEKFDFMVCSEVIEHLWNPMEAVRNLYSLLEDGGSLVLTTPCSFLPPSEERVDNVLYSLTGKRYVRPHLRFNYDRLVQGLQKVGFAVEGVRGCALYFPTYPIVYYFMPGFILPLLERIEEFLNRKNLLRLCAVTTCFKLVKR